MKVSLLYAFTLATGLFMMASCKNEPKPLSVTEESAEQKEARLKQLVVTDAVSVRNAEGEVISTFTIKNTGEVAAKDFKLVLEVAGADNLQSTVSDVVEPGHSKKVKDLKFGFASKDTVSFSSPTLQDCTFLNYLD
jgi:hypothetical protein